MPVSVIPYRSKIRSPNTRSNSLNAWGLRAALPDTYRRKACGRSSRVAASRSRRVYMVGTPKNIVNEPSNKASYTSAASNLRHISAVWRAGFISSSSVQKGLEIFAELDRSVQLGQVSAYAFELRPPLLIDKAQAYAGIVEDVLQLHLPILGVDWHHHAVRQVRTQVGRQEVRAVPEKERDALARPEAPGSQCRSEGLGSAAQPLVSPPLTLEPQAQFLRYAFGVAEERFDDRSRTRRHYRSPPGNAPLYLNAWTLIRLPLPQSPSPYCRALSL